MSDMVQRVVRLIEAVSSLKCCMAPKTSYAMGMRVSEVTGVEVRNIDGGPWSFASKPARTVMLCCRRSCSASCAPIGSFRGRNGFYSPVRDPDTAINTTVLHDACQSPYAAAGIDKKVSVPTLRHASFRMGYRYSYVRALLGHNNLSMTAGHKRVATTTITACVGGARYSPPPAGHFARCRLVATALDLPAERPFLR